MSGLVIDIRDQYTIQNHLVTFVKRSITTSVAHLTIFLRGLDRLIGYAVAAAKWLALPLITLLFLQWPLRDLFRGYSREANDLGQVAFAFFVALSVTAATRAGTHLAADVVARQYSARTRRRLNQIGAAAGFLPWALFVLIAGKGTVISSIRDL
jgi:TRAP-type mannitol/chloroaromatic compound transport system permease small subunit